MTIDEEIVELAQVTMKWRTHLWTEHQLRDAPPNLGFLLDGDEEMQHVPAEGWMAAEAMFSDRGMAEMIRILLGYVRTWDEFTRFRKIVFVSEGYGYPTESLDDVPESLEHDFKTNPATKVRENLTVTIAQDDLVGGCEIASAIIELRITDGGELVFDEPEIIGSDGPHEGNVIDVLRGAINAGS
jgi:hypothetical protein